MGAKADFVTGATGRAAEAGFGLSPLVATSFSGSSSLEVFADRAPLRERDADDDLASAAGLAAGLRAAAGLAVFDLVVVFVGIEISKCAHGHEQASEAIVRVKPDRGAQPRKARAPSLLPRRGYRRGPAFQHRADLPDW